MTDLVRTCEKTYSEELILCQGINIHELKFNDGSFPTKFIVRKFLNIVNNVFENDKETEKCIAVHCISGMRR